APARPDRTVQTRHGARPREPRIHVNDPGAPLPRPHHEPEPDRMTLGEVRAHDQDAVRVRQILLERRRSASTQRDPQTGDRGRVSYPRLVLHEDEPGAHAELLDQVVLLDRKSVV